MVKLIFISLLLLDYGYKLLRLCLTMKQRSKPLPESVRDIYDETQYARWLERQTDCLRFETVRSTVRFAVMLALFSTNAFSWLAEQLNAGVYGTQCLLICAYFLLNTLIGAPFHYIIRFKIEAKYGMNRCTLKTFFADCIKSFVLNAVLLSVVCALYIWVYSSFGAHALWISSLIAIAIQVVMTLFSSWIARIDNKLTPLEAGTLRDRLTQMFAREGKRLKDIYVMDASRRTARANAVCMGLGKLKKIVLYDNLVNDYTEDEIIAVFAHELGHFKNRDGLKITFFSLAYILLFNAAIGAFFFLPQISIAFGFTGTSAALAVLSVTDSDVFGAVNILWTAAASAFGRPMEIRADALAADYGYGEAIISFFKKIAQKELGDLNPHPVLIALEDEHPPIHKRIEAIRARTK